MPLRLYILFLFIAGVLDFKLGAQGTELPHIPTIEEKKNMDHYLEHLQGLIRNIPTAPPGPVRTMAEWEQVQALVITWAGQSAILREIVRHAVKETKVLIITNNATSVSDGLLNAGISLDSVQFVNTPFNSIWVRDYGPWTVYHNDVDSLYLIDWIYNRPREQDDATPLAIADHLDIPVYEAIADPDDLVHTGGNHLPDGMGTAFSSMLVLEENNDKTEDEIDTIVKKYLGVSQYIKFPTLPYDGIHHLDMHMRLIDEETIIFGEYPDGVADGPQINANIQYLLEEFKTPFGNDYKIIRMPMPPEGSRYPDEGGDYRTYTNSIFINKTILVPTYEERYDTTALRIYRENLPGYNVVGINCNSIIPSLGALHCITKLVGVNEPLLITHARLRDSDDAVKEYPVTAVIRHVSGIDSAFLYYRTSVDSNYEVVSMHLVDSLEHTWSGVIPPHVSGTEVQYYIHAIARNGKEQVRPLVAPEGYFRFRIEEESINQPPFVSITYPLDGAVFNTDVGSIAIEMDAQDPDGTINELVVFINEDSVGIVSDSPYVFNWGVMSEGDYQIRIRAKDDKDAISYSEPVVITIEEITSVQEKDEISIKMFPNPVYDVVTLPGLADVTTILSFTNLIGEPMDIAYAKNVEDLTIDFSSMPSGIYFINCIIETHHHSIKVIKL